MKKLNLLYILLALIIVTAACKEKAPPPPPSCSNICQPGEERTAYPECKCFTPAPPEPITPDAKLQAELFKAVTSGDLAVIKQNLDKYIDINAVLTAQDLQDFITIRENLKRNDFFYNNIRKDLPVTMLGLAIAADKVSIFNELITRKADLNIPAFGDYTPVELTLVMNDTDKAKMLIANGAKGDFFNPDNNYLEKALSKDRFPMAKIFVDYANANEIDISASFPPVSQAIQKGKMELVTFLLTNANTDPNYKDEVTDRYLITTAVLAKNKELIKLLIAAGSTLNIQDDKGRTPAMIFIESLAKEKDMDRTIEQNKTFLKTLAGDGADFNIKDKKGETVLFYAARTGKSQLVKALIDLGADVNIKNLRGQTVLFIPADAGHADMIKMLLDNGAFAKVKDKRGVTASTLAVQRGDMDTFDLLEKQPR